MVDKNGSMVLPKWGIWLFGLLGGAAIPWGVHVTTRLAVIEERVTNAISFESKLSEHLADPEIHHAGMAKVLGHVDHNATEIDALEKRIEGLEKRVFRNE